MHSYLVAILPGIPLNPLNPRAVYGVQRAPLHSIFLKQFEVGQFGRRRISMVLLSQRFYKVDPILKVDGRVLLKVQALNFNLTGQFPTILVVRLSLIHI